MISSTTGNDVTSKIEQPETEAMETEVEEKEQTSKLEIQEEDSPSKLLYRFPVGS